MRDKVIDAYSTDLIQIDLDGTLLHKAENLKSYGAVKRGALSALKVLKSLGYRIEVLTARENIPGVTYYLRKSSLKACISGVSNIKKNAILFIDDRGYRFNGSWRTEMKNVREILSYHRELAQTRCLK